MQIRQPFLRKDMYTYAIDSKHKSITPLLRSYKMENLTIVNARKFIKSLTKVFPMKKYIDGLLPDDFAFALDDEIRVDEGYIHFIIDALSNVPASFIGDMLYHKITQEVDFLIPPKVEILERATKCDDIVFKYDRNFHMAVTKHYLTEERKSFATDLTRTMLETTKSLINKVSYWILSEEMKQITKESSN